MAGYCDMYSRPFNKSGGEQRIKGKEEKEERKKQENTKRKRKRNNILKGNL